MRAKLGSFLVLGFLSTAGCGSSGTNPLEGLLPDGATPPSTGDSTTGIVDVTFRLPDAVTSEASDEVSCSGDTCVSSTDDAFGSCGDGVLAATEECDDGNRAPGDGCSPFCRKEATWFDCRVPGQLCVSTLACGDGKVQGGEFCDDRNTVPGDGCSETCAIEEGFACDKEGELCVKVASQFCGDGHLNATDQCDDGNATAGDGCTSCRIDQGYTCPTPGQPCVLDEYCGDNKVNGPVGSEACDDGNLAPGDGCDGTCKVERWWRCPPTGGACVSAIECGNGELEPGEACDDKNKAADDGCAADCKTVEPGWICNTAGAPCVKATEPVCGDGLLASWEQCDDGNTKADVDGCTADCTVLPGWRCDAPGMACAKIAFCGDGAINLDLGERCDDKNDADGDGCNKSCQVESGWKCLEAGKPCIRDGVCGDGRLHAGELCDDGNVANGDGCSADCKTVSPGWFCPTPGRLCMAEKCGDSIRAGLEQCDDGNELGTDGCNKYCQVEPGYTCTAGATKDVCTRVPQTCGNGTKEGTEQCDDNNLRPYDGCSETCTSEPRCGYGADGTYGCPATCGDGMRYITEACDDGNTQDGDGCSKDCKIESGWACNDTTGTSSPASLTLPIVFRDFMPSLGTPVLPSVAAGTGECAKDANRSPAGCVVRGHPHFEVNPFDQNVLWRGLVAPQLDGSGKPTYNTAYSGAQNVLAGNRRWTPAGLTGGVFTTANTRCGGEQAALNLSASDISSFFSLWYRDDGRYNYRVDSTLTLNRQTDGSYVFSAGTDSAPWMPLNGRGFGNLTYCGDSTRVGNFGFTSEVRYWFTFQGTGQESFSFYGDDDVWVFVNGQLVVDIGGIHGQVNGSVTLTPTGNATAEVDTAPGVRGTATTIPLGLQLGGLYEIAIFQAERQAYGSNYKLTLRGFNAPRSQCNTVCGIQPPAIMTPIVTPDEQCDLGSANAGTGANTPYDGCTTTCNLGPRCGDKSVQTAAGETCDNGINADFRVASAAETVGKCGPGCKAPSYCGDNSVDTAFGEQCDKGAENSDTAYGPGMCKTNCTLAARCGDGKPDLASGEQCDTGINNGTPSSICDIECKLKCGNGKPDAGEECDNGAALNVGGYNGCTSVCKKGPFCGDGKTDLSAGEVCDDGRNDGTYGTCGKGCTVRAPYCGDGVPDLAAGEACDKGANNSATAYGRDQCTNRCRLAPYCGDKQVNGTEGCDDGVNSGLPGSCTVDCKSYVPLTSCGDGSVQPPEQCDFGRAVNGTQASTCDARCRTKCGNGILDPGEICDEGDNTGAYGHCAPGCVLGGYCGDGVPNGPEQCDLGTQNQANPYGRNLCTVQCTTAPFCGDGRIQAERGEECDSSPGCDSACKKIIAILR